MYTLSTQDFYIKYRKFQIKDLNFCPKKQQMPLCEGDSGIKTVKFKHLKSACAPTLVRGIGFSFSL